ncbi:PaaI family thioesterase [Gemmatimonadota bacterium]
MTSGEEKCFQDFYDDDMNHCYGCGQLNEHGLRIQTRWEKDEAVCRFTPKEFHTAIPGYVYGGLIASLIDCNGTGTAAAAGYRHEGREMDSEPRLRYVTASLNVEYLRPTPLTVLEIRSRVKEVKGRKVVVSISLYAAGNECARGEVTAVRIPEDWGK